MIASSSAFWWCSGFSFHDETAVANVGSLYHRATTYSLELYLPVRTVAANDDSIVSSHLALMMPPTLGSRHICRNHHLGSWHLCQRGSRHICRNHHLGRRHICRHHSGVGTSVETNTSVVGTSVNAGVGTSVETTTSIVGTSVDTTRE